MSRDASGGGRLMNSILYGNFRIEILTDVGGKLERISLQKAASQPAARQPTTPADGEAPLLLDREDEPRPCSPTSSAPWNCPWTTWTRRGRTWSMRCSCVRGSGTMP